jgi:hypothetical protein
MRRRRVLAAVLLLGWASIALTTVATGPAGAEGRLPPNPTPLSYVNYYRETARVPPVTENPQLSEAARRHAVYVVRNDVITHSEDPGNQWYTPEGAAAGGRSNVFGSSNPNTSDLTAIDGWMSAPFHAVAMIDPRLTQIGYGAHREAGGTIAMGAALDIATVGTGNAGFPVRWPADGMSVPLSVFPGEIPDPLTSCGFGGSAGLPVILMLGPGVQLGAVSASITADGVPVETCEIDGSNYRNPDAAAQQTGRNILNSRGAIIAIPRTPLFQRTRYDVSITAAGGTHAWSFTRLQSFNGARPVVTTGNIQSAPATAAVRGAEAVDVFVRGTDAAVYRAGWNGSQWNAWQFLGAPPGGAAGDPAAVSWEPGRLDVFTRGPDNRLWQIFSTDGGASWSGWLKPLGDDGVLASGPEVVSRGPGRLDVFVRGTDGLIYQRFYDGQWNGSWLAQGAPPAGTEGEPAAAAQDSVRVDLFVRGGDGRLWHKSWNGSAWSGWSQPPGSGNTGLSSPPQATSWGPGHLAVFARGTDGGVIELTFDGAWSLWTPVGRSHEIVQGAVGAASRGAGRIDLFARGTDNLPYQFWM